MQDSSKNADYCKYCYENAIFTQPEIQTAKNMQACCKNILKEQACGRLKGLFQDKEHTPTPHTSLGSKPWIVRV